jgi:predicted nucleotidyltransferase
MAQTSVVSVGIDLPLEKIREICRRHHVRELSIFGSALRDDFRPDSDVDLLVDFEPDARIGFIELGVLERELAGALGRKIDLGTKGSVRPELRDEILGSARVVYEAA